MTTIKLMGFWLMIFLSFEAQAMKEKSGGAVAAKGNERVNQGPTVLGDIQLPSVLFKILSLKDWEKSEAGDKVCTPPSDDSFIHFSTEKQKEAIIAKKFSNCSYVVLRVDLKQLVGTVALEWDSQKIDRYYHLYNGYIPKTAVIVEGMTVLRERKNT
jgi:uncharacterized protein (DUF952 family)